MFSLRPEEWQFDTISQGSIAIGFTQHLKVALENLKVGIKFTVPGY